MKYKKKAHLSLMPNLIEVKNISHGVWKGYFECQADFKLCPNGFLNIFWNFSFSLLYVLNESHSWFLFAQRENQALIRQ